MSFLYLAADDAYPIGGPMNAEIHFYVLSTVVQPQILFFHRSLAWQRKQYSQRFSDPLSSLSVRPPAAAVEEVYSVSIFVLLPAQSAKTN